MLDTSENAAIIEAARYNASNSIPSTATLIKNDKLRAALPTDAFMAANSHPDYRTGIFVRHLNYSVPSAFHGFNEGLFELAGVPYAASDFSNATGQVFPSWETEDADWFKIGSRYFSPVRMPYDDVALVTNFALTPQLRVAQMTFWASLFPGDSMQVCVRGCVAVAVWLWLCVCVLVVRLCCICRVHNVGACTVAI